MVIRSSVLHLCKMYANFTLLAPYKLKYIKIVRDIKNVKLYSFYTNVKFIKLRTQIFKKCNFSKQESAFYIQLTKSMFSFSKVAFISLIVVNILWNIYLAHVMERNLLLCTGIIIISCLLSKFTFYWFRQSRIYNSVFWISNLLFFLSPSYLSSFFLKICHVSKICYDPLIVYNLLHSITS